MESIRACDDLVEFNPDTLEVVRNMFGYESQAAIKEAVDLLDDWVQKQAHFLKKDFSKEYLERIIIASKGSVERAKARLDKLFTLRSMMPIFFRADYDLRTDFEDMKDIITIAAIPKMTEDYDRILLCKVTGKNFTSKMYLDAYRLSFMLSEYARAHDYSNGIYLVIDYLDASIQELIAAADFSHLRQAIIAQMEGYSMRVKGIHLLVDSKLLEVIVKIVKQILSEKVGNRVHYHRTLDTLWDHIPQKLFPKEYGGAEKPLKELNEHWMKILGSEENMRYWRMMTAAKTDESLRRTDNFNEKYMGLPGTFRTLSVD